MTPFVFANPCTGTSLLLITNETPEALINEASTPSAALTLFCPVFRDQVGLSQTVNVYAVYLTPM